MSRASDNYLYAIRTLKDRFLCVRSVDVAHYLGFSKASVSVFVRQMRDEGLIEMEADGNLLLTSLGRERADLLNERVCFFQQLLMDAGVEASQALQDSVSFSWNMSEKSYEAFKGMYRQSLKDPPDGVMVLAEDHKKQQNICFSDNRI